jgi:hypothetical protein
MGTIGFVLLTGAIDVLLTPPFKSPPNYGQFGILVMCIGFYMSLFGACLGVVPYFSWRGYVPIHLLGLFGLWSLNRQSFADVDWREAPIVALLVVLLLPSAIAVWIDQRIRRHAASESGE